jgi:purine nucleosidase
LAPLTTLAIAIGLDQSLAERVDELWIMGGAIDGIGFMNLSTEFNFDRDPDAAYRVLRDFKNIKIVPIETGPNGTFTAEETVSIRLAGTEFSKFFKEISYKLLIDKDENEGKMPYLN